MKNDFFSLKPEFNFYIFRNIIKFYLYTHTPVLFFQSCSHNNRKQRIFIIKEPFSSLWLHQLGIINQHNIVKNDFFSQLEFNFFMQKYNQVLFIHTHLFIFFNLFYTRKQRIFIIKEPFFITLVTIGHYQPA